MNNPVTYFPDGTFEVSVGDMSLNWDESTPDMVEVVSRTADEPEYWDKEYIPVSTLKRFLEAIDETIEEF